MNRSCLIGLIWMWIAPAVGLAAGDDLVEARRLLLSGKYAEAAETYARSAENAPEAALGLARSLAAEGKYDEAIRALGAPEGEHADLEAERARLAFERGDYQAAEARVEAAIRLDPEQLLAWWIRGELFRTAGRLEEAEEAYRWLITFYNGHDVRRAESLRWIGLAAARYARWNRLHDQFRFLVNELYPDALQQEPGYWPAHYEAGLLFLEKYNQKDAAKELKAALELNPNAAEVHAALARLALLDHRIEEAQASLERALEINPRLAAGWLGKADLAWANFQVPQAIELLEKQALPLNPVSEAALGRLAAGYLLGDNPAEGGESLRFRELVEEVTGRNQHAGEFFFTLAWWLEERHKMRRAEGFLHETIRRMPQTVGPRSHLGLIYMRQGRETEARGVLEEAFEIDPFNVRVKNTLEVLDVLDSMETFPTEHCVLKCDGQRDELLARYASRYLDSIYPELCERFGYRPAEKPLIEIFNQARGVNGHQWFSARMVGLPYLGTVAASTGKIVAMTSPNEPNVAKKFNWAQVLKHEMVHVITLQQTDFNIPHWYTEALAVWVEGYPRPQVWNEVLLKRVSEGDLFDLDSINFGFTRPNSSDDWALAYCQAELYVEYMLKNRSAEVLRELLAAYADNLTTAEAIRRVFGTSQEEFEQGYVAYLEKLAAELSGLEPRQEESFADLLRTQREHPNDARLAAEVARGYLRRGAHEEALQMARRALELQPKHQRATYVVARLEVRAGRTEHAVELLEDCLDRKAPDPIALNLLAGLKLKAKKYDQAAELYQLGASHDPYNLQWSRALMRVYLWSKNDEKLAEVLGTLARADSSDFAARKKLALLALEAKDFQAAANWANRALEIDVTDAEAHRVFAESLVGRHNYIQAIEEYEAAVALNPEQPGLRFALADAYLRAGKPAEARRVLQSLLKLAPDYPGAESLLKKLKEKQEP